MTTNDDMTVNEVDKYLKKMRPIYLKVKLRIKWSYIDTDYLIKSLRIRFTFSTVDRCVGQHGREKCTFYVV